MRLLIGLIFCGLLAGQSIPTGRFRAAGAAGELAGTFNGTSSKCSSTSVPASALPVTMFAEVRPTSVTGDRVAVSVSVASAGHERTTLLGSGTNLRLMVSGNSGSGNGTAQIASVFAIGTKKRIGGRSISTTSRTSYADGLTAVNDTQNVISMGTQNRTTIGVLTRDTDLNWYAGDIRLVAIWTTDPGDTVLANLVAGTTTPAAEGAHHIYDFDTGLSGGTLTDSGATGGLDLTCVNVGTIAW